MKNINEMSLLEAKECLEQHIKDYPNNHTDDGAKQRIMANNMEKLRERIVYLENPLTVSISETSNDTNNYELWRFLDDNMPHIYRRYLEEDLNSVLNDFNEYKTESYVIKNTHKIIDKKEVIYGQDNYIDFKNIHYVKLVAITSEDCYVFKKIKTKEYVIIARNDFLTQLLENGDEGVLIPLDNNKWEFKYE